MNDQSYRQVVSTSAMFLPSWARTRKLAAAAIFLISLAFPVTASLSKNTGAFPKWWGPLDVGPAFVLAILAFVIYGLARGHVNKQTEQTTYGAYRLLIHGILVLILLFFLLGGRIIWINGLPGIAWRAWLLLYSLPEWYTVVGAADR